MKIRKGDNVIVISGKARGQKGVVRRVFPKTERVIVEGVNTIKKHEKSRQQGSRGQIIERPAPIHVSNIALIDPKSNKPGRVGFTIDGEGEKAKKVRVMRPSGEKVT